jgi:hypothetical protein
MGIWPGLSRNTELKRSKWCHARLMISSVSCIASSAQRLILPRWKKVVNKTPMAVLVDAKSAYEPICVLVASVSGLCVQVANPVAKQIPRSMVILKTTRSRASSVAFSNAFKFASCSCSSLTASRPEISSSFFSSCSVSSNTSASFLFSPSLSLAEWPPLAVLLRVPFGVRP